MKVFSASKSSLLLMILAFSSASAFAKLERTPPKVSKITHKNCKATDTCDLKSFELKVNEYKVTLDETHEQFGTAMVASYETKNKNQLEKYGIVQYIQGCQWLSREEKGKVVNYPVIMREFMGENIPYFIKDMTIDGFTNDPLYLGVEPQENRHFYYLTIDPSIDYSGKDYYGVRGAVSNKLYMVDHPGIAGYYPESGRAYNISLKFKTCLFKTEDVPRVVTDHQSQDFAEPLHCLEWASSYVFNHAKKKFETLPEIAPYCNEYQPQ